MTLPFFYEPDVAGVSSHFQLSEDTSKHCIQVLRMKAGSLIRLTNGKGYSYNARIVEEDRKKAVVLLESEIFVPQQQKKIAIGISLLKNTSRFEWFLEKATEIGISEIIPLLCERTEHTRFRADRMQHILVSAMLQSQQLWLPVLREPIAYKTALSRPDYQLKLLAHCEEDSKNNIGELPPFSDALIMIGPEGDFSPAEIQTALDLKFIPVTLGQTRLRTETAGMVAATLLINS